MLAKKKRKGMYYKRSLMEADCTEYYYTHMFSVHSNIMHPLIYCCNGTHCSTAMESLVTDTTTYLRVHDANITQKTTAVVVKCQRLEYQHTD